VHLASKIDFYPYTPILGEKNLIFSDFSLFWNPKTHFHIGRLENEEKVPFLYRTQNYLPDQNQLVTC
jgi:hypothetical protein